MVDEEQVQTVTTVRRKPLFGRKSDVVRQEEMLGKTAILAALANLVVATVLLASIDWLGSLSISLLLCGLFQIGVVALLSVICWKSTSYLLNAWGIRAIRTAGGTLLWFAVYAVLTITFLLIGGALILLIFA